MFAMIHNHNRKTQEELLFNSGGSVQKTLYPISPEATLDQLKGIFLRNHSNLKIPSQHMSAFQSIQQKPDEALQTYNTRYESYYQLAHPGLSVDDNASKVSCIHNANFLYGKLGDEMEGRLNQELPDSLQAAFQRAVNFEQRVLTKQQINTRKVMTTKRLRSMSHASGTPIIKVRTMIQIIKRTSITIILTTASTTHLDLDTSLTITTMEGTSTTAKAITQRNQQMFK